MEREHALRDDQYNKIRDLLPSKKSNCGVTLKDNRLFIEFAKRVHLSETFQR